MISELGNAFFELPTGHLIDWTKVCGIGPIRNIHARGESEPQACFDIYFSGHVVVIREKLDKLEEIRKDLRQYLIFSK